MTFRGLGLPAALALFLGAGAGSAQTPPSTQIAGFAVDPKGNFGVGTSAPQALLDVAGDALVEGAIKGGGINGQFGSAAVISGFDTRYGQRKFVLQYDGISPSPTNIQIHAIDPVDPTQSVFKTFIIAHPSDRERYLVHASIEGPEGAVYYRGSAQLKHGRATLRLPSYFEGLTRKDGRTVQLTNVDGFDPIAVKSVGGASIVDGAVLIVSKNARSQQRFDWEVKAIRADGPPLVVEPLRSEVKVGGLGPYTYQLDASPPPGAPEEKR